MIHTMLCSEGQEFKWDLRQSEIGRVLAHDENILWLDLQDPTPEELELLASEFKFHPLALEDAQKRQRPKVEQYDDFNFLVFYDIDYDEASNLIDEHQLGIFFGRNYLVTVHYEPIEEIDEVAGRWQHNVDQIGRGVGVLVYSLLDTIVDHYFAVVDGIGDRIEEMETRVFTQADRESLLEIFTLRRELLNLRRTISPERDVMAMLARRDLPVVGEAVTIYFQDVYDHVLRVTEAIDTYRELLSDVLNSYLSVNANNMAMTSNNLNQVMRVLTSVSIILMSVTLIASIYGMNFDNMPELHTRYGYFVALLVMLTLGLGLAVFFKRRNWL
jgi:magnesium transporter